MIEKPIGHLISCPRNSAVTVLLALGMAGFIGCGERDQPQAPAPRPVVVTKLVQTDPSQALRLTGVVESWAQEDIGFEVAGRVDYIVEAGTFLEGRWVEEGQVVIEGDMLATIDRAPYEAAYQAAQADVDYARVNLDSVLPARLAEAKANQVRQETEFAKIEQLHKNQSATEVELIEARAARDAAEAQVDQAQAQLEAGKASLAKAEAALLQAQLDLDHTQLIAPFTGEVAEVFVKAGGFVSAGQAVAKLVTMDPVKVKVTVSAQTNRKISLDDPVQLFVPDRDEPQFGAVYQKSTAADSSTRTFPVTLISRNRRVLTNPTDDPDVLKLPRIPDLMPATRAELGKPGPIWVEERRVLAGDETGYHVWTLEGVSLREGIDLSNPVFTVRKVSVVPGQQRMNLQGIYYLRELSDDGGLEFLQALAMDVPEGVQDGDQVALLRESWMLQPGSLIDVQFKRQTKDTGSSRRLGYYVPIRAVMPESTDTGHIFVVDESVKPARARRVDVTLGQTVGQLQRIHGDALEALGEGAGVIVEGVNYVLADEPVIIVQNQVSLP